MIDGHGDLVKEEDSGWAGQGVSVGMADGQGAFVKEGDSESRLWFGESGCLSGDGR